MELALSALTTEQFNLRRLAGVTPLPPGHPTLQELLQCRTALDGLLRR